MTIADIIGSTGVAMILIAFFLNLINYISNKSFWYILMNFIGAGLACYASILLKYLPFIILEATWTLVSFAALLNLLNQKKV
ncbi:hypothetical protein ACFLSE_02365 [Bacteroidota bacterium]